MAISKFLSTALLTVFTMTSQAQTTTEMVYPQAEWSTAGDILMHTPGQELFCGVIHPNAGLFDNYFDVDKRPPRSIRGISVCSRKMASACILSQTF